jgi:hypothetical protein
VRIKCDILHTAAPPLCGLSFSGTAYPIPRWGRSAFISSLRGRGYEKGKKDQQVKLDITPGQSKFLRGVYYKGTVKMNLIGFWKKGMKDAMWIATNIDPKRVLEIYLDRMKIEESFKDLKSLLGLERIMSKDRQYMGKLIMLVLIAYTIGVLVGEKIRDRTYRSEKKWNRYSGLFILIRQRVTLPGKEIRKMKVLAYRLFQQMLHAPGVVPT